MALTQRTPNYLPSELWLQILGKIPIRSQLRFRLVCKTWNSMLKDRALYSLILQRLPVKDLLRCRSVCKTWRSIIDDSDFASMQLSFSKKHSDKRIVLSFFDFIENHNDSYRRGLRVSTRTIDTYDLRREIWTRIYSNVGNDYARWTYLGYLDGMLLMAEFTGCIELTLWNPSIISGIKLQPVLHNSRYYLGSIFMGYDPATEDYKVVVSMIPRHDTPPNWIEPHCSLAVYALKTGYWRFKWQFQFQNFMVGKIWRNVSQMVFAKGVANWFAYDVDGRKGVRRPKGYTKRISFDFATERFSCTRLPDDGHRIRERILLPFQFGDSLAVFSISLQRSSIWVMIEQDHILELWTQTYPPFAHLNSYMFFLNKQKHINIFSYDEEIQKIYFKDDEYVRWYDLETHEMDEVGYIIWESSQVYPYVESLLLSKPFAPNQTIISFPEVVRRQ